MSEHLALLFPGQGSQKVGMGKALYDGSPAAKAVFDEADSALGFPLSRLCFEGPEDHLSRTANTQPAILTTSLAALAALRERCDLRPTVALGHSLGEFSALVAVGALAFGDAVRLVHLRGQAMQEAVPSGQGAMAAVLRLDAEVVARLCAEAAQGDVLSPANENGGGQIVVAGSSAAVARLVTAVSEAKGRAIPLKVSAPFHCSLMKPAADRLASALASIEMGPMSAPVIANVDGRPNQDPGRVKGLLIAQVTGRVRWEKSVLEAQRMGVQQAVEVGHGTVLTGLVRRIAKSIVVHKIGSTCEIDAFASR